MTTGVIFLVVMTIVAMSDLFIALRYRRLADTGDRRAAVLVSPGKIPVGRIDPIKL